MQSNSETNQDIPALKFKRMIINTSELKRVMEDEDFDGLTLQVSQEFGGPNGPGDRQRFKFLAYKHFRSKKKQEQITDPAFFAATSGEEAYVELSGDKAISNFGNLKLTRAEMNEDIDSEKYPYLILTPERGTGEYENYIICTASYSDKITSAPSASQSLSRGASLSNTKSLRPIKPSPPA